MLAPGIVQLALTFAVASQGAVGAAIAAAAGALTGGALLGLIGRRLVALPLPLGALARIAGACALMVGVVLVCPPLTGALGLALAVTAGGAAYGIGLIAFDVMGARARASTVSQNLKRTLRGVIHSLFTDRADVRTP